jgi:hypothetical protein
VFAPTMVHETVGGRKDVDLYENWLFCIQIKYSFCTLLLLLPLPSSSSSSCVVVDGTNALRLWY